MKIYPILVVTLSLTLCLLISPAGAWSSGGTTNGHTTITTGAIKHLPQPLYDFFNRNSATIIANSAIEPDPSYTHYIDIDYYPEFAAHTFPHDQSVLVARYGLSTVQDKGTGPWALADTQSRLSLLMHIAVTQQDWIDLLSAAGTLAHYTEDLHNPLHLAVNYNGQLTGQTGIHSRYETTMIKTHFAQLAPVANPTGCVYLPSVIDSIFSEIDIDYAYNANILNADLTARALDPKYSTTYYNSMWNNCGAFTIQLFQDASEQLASQWYTAWVDAGSPNPPCYYTLTGDLNGDCTVDFLDLTLFSQQWSKTCTATAWCNGADTNHSYEVDFLDYTILASNWLTDCCDWPTPAACVE